MNKKQWVRFLKAKTHSDSAWSKADDHANNWHACAVGCALELPRDHRVTMKSGFLDQIESNEYIAQRLTRKAESLGMKFYKAIENRNIKEARKIFRQIQGLDKYLVKKPHKIRVNY